MVTTYTISPALPRLCAIDQMRRFQGAAAAGVLFSMETIRKLFRLLIDPATEPGERSSAARAMRQAMDGNGITVESIVWKFEPPKPKQFSRAVYPMPFGKFKGKRICDIPTDYLIFIIEKMDKAPDWLIAAAAEIIAEREGES